MTLLTFHAKLGVSCQLQQKQHYQQTESHHRGNHNDSVYLEKGREGGYDLANFSLYTDEDEHDDDSSYQLSADHLLV